MKHIEIATYTSSNVVVIFSNGEMSTGRLSESEDGKAFYVGKYGYEFSARVVASLFIEAKGPKAAPAPKTPVQKATANAKRNTTARKAAAAKPAAKKATPAKKTAAKKTTTAPKAAAKKAAPAPAKKATPRKAAAAKTPAPQASGVASTVTVQGSGGHRRPVKKRTTRKG